MMYGATTSMLMNIFGPMGVETAQVDACDLAAFEAALAEDKPGAVIVGDHRQSSAARARARQDRRVVPRRRSAADRR